MKLVAICMPQLSVRSAAKGDWRLGTWAALARLMYVAPGYSERTAAACEGQA